MRQVDLLSAEDHIVVTRENAGTLVELRLHQRLIVAPMPHDGEAKETHALEVASGVAVDVVNPPLLPTISIVRQLQCSTVVLQILNAVAPDEGPPLARIGNEEGLPTSVKRRELQTTV